MLPHPSVPPHRADRQAATVMDTLRVARALVQSRRTIDLAGLDQEIGRLCAFSLDLPRPEAMAMRATLCAVLAELDDLARLLVETGDHA